VRLRVAIRRRYRVSIAGIHHLTAAGASAWAARVFRQNQAENLIKTVKYEEWESRFTYIWPINGLRLRLSMSRCAAGSNWMNHGTFGELLCHLTTGTRQRDWRPDTDPSFPKYPRLPIIERSVHEPEQCVRLLNSLLS